MQMALGARTFIGFGSFPSLGVPPFSTQKPQPTTHNFNPASNMASIAASPTLAPHQPTPSSSRRTSVDTRTSSPARAPTSISSQGGQPRRNRAALRDYYGIKSTTPSDASGIVHSQDEGQGVKESELDKDGFDAEAYVRGLLGKEGLEGVLKEEGGLINRT